MKRLLALLVIGSLLFTGCKNDNDPKSVAIKFFDALSKKDIAGARKYATESSKELLDLIETTMKIDDGKSKKDAKFDTKNMEFSEPKIEGNKATISVKNKAENETEDIVLKKEGDAWKVAFDKETMNEGKKKMGEMKNHDMDKEGISNKTDDTKKENSKPDAKVNMGNFDKIKTGMSYDDVVTIFGGDKGLASGGGIDTDGKAISTFTWKAEEGFDTIIQVTFDKAENKVVTKEQEGL